MKGTIKGGVVLLALLLFSCGEAHKILQSKDKEFKYKAAEGFYAAKKFGKAIVVFEGILEEYRGFPEEKTILERLVEAYMSKGEGEVAMTYLDRLMLFDLSPKEREKYVFLQIKSLFLQSPDYHLDQQDTVEAIEGFQVYLDRYPETSHRSEIEKNLEELKLKIEKKDYEILELYFKLKVYKSVIVVVENFLLKHPNGVYKEKAMYLKLSALYEIYSASVPDKKEIRRRKAEGFFKVFKRQFPNSQEDLRHFNFSAS